MAKQDRAIRTRQSILEAAAVVFDERGYDAATITEILARAEVTKGALYFHFASKEELALAVIDAQMMTDLPVAEPGRASKMQEMVDMGMIFAHRLLVDPLLRGSVRLTLEHGSTNLNRSGPFHGWTDLHTRVLAEGKERGEVLPHVIPADTAELIVGAYAGINTMSQAINNRADLERRATVLYEHVMPSVAVPSVLARLDMAPGRGARALAEAERQRRRAAEAEGALEAAPAGVG
ncbi:ScbR family autoregulator-binding transcription factor [Streptomyces sp. UNOB3_S3]|uniref:ScbR family autoregulator-binding transcription factor n=1 Tax=Streptomyces sp. UNOB3_S3 TaxID=2871682 RepID=UPI001E3932A4|nr:ScbR family autoregulator-binding transcription factor [Streptomyces sp. UNOB3_S3]MCC3777375.1 TetR/AcrR family transcriptional regulator [Streptomyces sp. UNOB3_S3]